MNDPDVIDELIRDLPDLITTEELADALRVKPVTVLKWGKDLGLKSIAIGARIRRYRKNDVRAFLIAGDEISEAE